MLNVFDGIRVVTDVNLTDLAVQTVELSWFDWLCEGYTLRELLFLENRRDTVLRLLCFVRLETVRRPSTSFFFLDQNTVVCHPAMLEELRRQLLENANGRFL